MLQPEGLSFAEPWKDTGVVRARCRCCRVGVVVVSGLQSQGRLPHSGKGQDTTLPIRMENDQASGVGLSLGTFTKCRFAVFWAEKGFREDVGIVLGPKDGEAGNGVSES